MTDTGLGSPSDARFGGNELLGVIYSLFTTSHTGIFDVVVVLDGTEDFLLPHPVPTTHRDRRVALQ